MDGKTWIIEEFLCFSENDIYLFVAVFQLQVKGEDYLFNLELFQHILEPPLLYVHYSNLPMYYQIIPLLLLGHSISDTKKTFTQLLYNVGPPSAKLTQHSAVID